MVSFLLGLFFFCIGLLSFILMLLSTTVRNLLKGKVKCPDCGEWVRIPTDGVICECPKCGKVEIWF